MKLAVEVSPDFESAISLVDYSREFGEYLDEDLEVILPRYYNFKYSQTCSINVLKYLPSSGDEIVKVVYQPHITEADSIRLPLIEDGYYTLTHIVLPTIDWLDEVKEEDLSEYNYIYITDGKKVYLYKDEELREATIEELLEINPYKTTISITEHEAFSMKHLQECYVKASLEILKNYANSCNNPCSGIDDQLRFNRDFLWMTINVIKYYLQWGMYKSAQSVLEDLGCYDFCGDNSQDPNTKGKPCGCNKSRKR